MNPNEPESRGGLPAMLRAVGALAVLVVAMIGILAVLDAIPADALKEWFTKAALVFVILVAAVAAIWVMMRGGGASKS